MTEVLTYEALKAERDALERQLSMSEAKCKGYFSDAAAALVKCDALAVENQALNEMNSSLCAELREYESDDCQFGPMPQSVVNCFALHTPATSAALAAIQAQGVEKFADMCREKSKLATTADSCAGWKNCSVHASSFAIRLREAK